MGYYFWDLRARISVVHPLVLLSVVDHASRSPTSSKKRVLGVLLGQNDGKTVNVANSFAVRFFLFSFHTLPFLRLR